jgi:hypothetical protein
VSSDLAKSHDNKVGDSEVREHIVNIQPSKTLVTSPGTLLHPIWTFEDRGVSDQSCQIPASGKFSQDFSENISEVENSENEEVIEEIDIGANVEVSTSKDESNKSNNDIRSRLRKRDERGFVVYENSSVGS